MVQISAAIVDADKTIANQMTSYKNYIQVSSEISVYSPKRNDIFYANSAIGNDKDAFLSSGSILSVLCITLKSAFWP